MCNLWHIRATRSSLRDTLRVSLRHALRLRYQQQSLTQPYCFILSIAQQKLRFFTRNGQLVSTAQEVALQETQRAERLAAKLRELKIDPDAL